MTGLRTTRSKNWTELNWIEAQQNSQHTETLPVSIVCGVFVFFFFFWQCFLAVVVAGVRRSCILYTISCSLLFKYSIPPGRTACYFRFRVRAISGRHGGAKPPLQKSQAQMLQDNVIGGTDFGSDGSSVGNPGSRKWRHFRAESGKGSATATPSAAIGDWRWWRSATGQGFWLCRLCEWWVFVWILLLGMILYPLSDGGLTTLKIQQSTDDSITFASAVAVGKWKLACQFSTES